MIALTPTVSLTEQEQAAVIAFLERVRRDYTSLVQDAILFGSKARGDSSPDSDIDVLIVVGEENWPLRDAISLIAARTSLEYDVLLGPRVIGLERWQRMQRERATLYENIAREGVTLVSVL